MHGLRVESCAATPQPRRRYGRALALVLFAAIVAAHDARADAPMRFGIDADSAATAVAKGLPMSYGSIWAGAWNQKWGWGGIETQLRAAKSAGVAPVIQWWYWGDDISPSCVEHGCVDRYEGVFKDKATWYRLSNELADLIARVAGPDSGAIVIVETEFNKSGIETYEPFDGYLTDHARIFHDRRLSVVVSFGNWDPQYWPTFDRAAAAADLLGAMALQSSVHEASTYLSGADMLIAQARRLQSMFGKPVFVTDFAFSSYPEPNYEYQQDTVVKSIFARMSELKAAGVRGMVWRMLVDDPNFDTSNYHGMAERSWGLIRADGSAKLAFYAFLNGMRAETTVAPTTTPTPSQTPAPTPVQPPASGLTTPNLGWSVAGSAVTLNWTAVNGATSYIVEAGSASGSSDLARFATNSTATGIVVPNVPAGVYYLRVRGANGSAVGPASNEALVVVR